MHACLRLLCLLLCTLTGSASQAAWPERPIRMIVPYAPGSSPDNICRLLAQEMAKSLGVNIVIDNRAGASGSVGTEAIAKAAADGYTIGYGNIGTLTTNRFMIAKLPYDPDRDLTLIGSMGAVQNMLAVNNNLPVKNVRDLIALAKKSPGKLVMASGGAGNTGHLGGELFKSMTGTFMLHVPYRGSPAAITDLIGGQADLMFDNLSSVGTHAKAGRVRGIAVSGLKRSPAFPARLRNTGLGRPGHARQPAARHHRAPQHRTEQGPAKPGGQGWLLHHGLRARRRHPGRVCGLGQERDTEVGGGDQARRGEDGVIASDQGALDMGQTRQASATSTRLSRPRRPSPVKPPR